MDEMKLIGFMYLLSFCSHLSAAPINVTSEISMLIRRIIWTNWNQSNIEFNLDSVLDTPKMIRKAGYPAEVHVVMTEDGYLLTLHRIPGDNDSLPVLLQHGLLGSSADWVVLGKDKAFAYLLADQGYDVWLGNFRGNIYSKAHISLSPSNLTFWDFRFLLEDICDQNIEFCSNIMSMIWGDDREQFNITLLPVILKNIPAGTSTKTILHFIQVFESGKFRKYNYGRERNLLIYNLTEPPNYNLSNITIPIVLFYADNDWLIDTEDVKKLYHSLPNVVDMYKVPWSKFNHVDFIWAKDAPKLVYDRILKIMKGENPKNVTSME